MRAVIQRVLHASVSVGGEETGSIGRGLLIFLGVGKEDTSEDLSYLHSKIMSLRIFEDEAGKMNQSVQDIGGELLVVSQFTLYGDCRKGRRPSFDQSMNPKEAKWMYDQFIVLCRETQLRTQTGIFGADMKVSLLNDGPVTILLDSKKLF